MFCTSCGKNLGDDCSIRFCVSCGKQVKGSAQTQQLRFVNSTAVANKADRKFTHKPHIPLFIIMLVVVAIAIAIAIAVHLSAISNDNGGQMQYSMTPESTRPTPTPSPKPTPEPFLAPSWYTAYMDFILDEMFLYSRYTYFPDCEEFYFNNEGYYHEYALFHIVRDIDILDFYKYSRGIKFSLHDINDDGIPELIIHSGGWAAFISVWYVYTYIDGEVKEAQGIYESNLKHAPGTDFPGLFVFNALTGERFDHYIELVDGLATIAEIVRESTHILIDDKFVSTEIYRTPNEDLFRAFEISQNHPVVFHTLDEIRTMGWDRFVRSYEFSFLR
ncbi:MAG: hypothetical protein FWE83_06570 [Oscillospiraceae bacterium]|nr:hypothetical protein [Oscillospiraceae bacterium]